MRQFMEGHIGMDPIDRKTLLKRARKGEVIVVDVRPVEEYRAGHIPGAVSIPLKTLESRLLELPIDKEIVAYCRGPYCILAVQAVKMLRAKGFMATRLEDGVHDWRAHGFDIDVGDEKRKHGGAL